TLGRLWRWAVARASACWTSTRTGIERAGCSNCWAFACPRLHMPEIVARRASSSALSQLGELRRIAIVPALNEELTVRRVIEELRTFDAGLDIVVIDDGSADRTAAVAAENGAHVLRLPF